MKCTSCESKKELIKEKRTVKYDECGLDNIVLVNTHIFKCAECGEEIHSYGNIHILHNLIKDAILRNKEILTGPQVRFLRKHFGYSKENFAHLLQVDVRTIARWESGRNITPQVDRSIRLAVAASEPSRDYAYHDELLGKKEFINFKLLKIHFSPKSNALTPEYA